MSQEQARELLENWRYFDPYDQRLLIRRFLEQCGREASREQWLVFLAEELAADTQPIG